MKHGVPSTYRNNFDRFRLQMYQFAVMEQSGIDNFQGKTLLETGCGRGGGLNYLAQLLRPRYAIGVDASRGNIQFCKNHWPHGSHVQCDFIVADVERLTQSVPRMSIDYMVDIESFFYYTDKNAFLHEAHDCLKEDGLLFLSFFIQRTKLEEIHAMMRNYFDILKETDITDNVVHSLRLDTPRLSRFSSENFPFRKLNHLVTSYSNE